MPHRAPAIKRWSHSVAQRHALIAQANPAGLVHARCQALGLVRSSRYYQPLGKYLT